MSDKTKYPRADALAVAREICEALKPIASRLIVAGSLRRGRQEVGDVEILYVPKTEERKVDFFDTAAVDLVHEWAESALQYRILDKRPSSIGVFTWGPKNKLAVHVSGMPVDLFATTEENWWVSLVVRTGGLQTNLRLTTGAQDRGCSLIAYGAGVKQRDGTIIQATSEQHVFELCGVKYLEPKDRA